MTGKFFSSQPIIIAIIALQIVFVSHSCVKNCKKYYQLEVPISVSPQKDSMNIGDTLWIKANFSSEVRDFVSGEYIKVDHFDFNTNLRFHELVNDSAFISNQPGAFNHFDVVEKTGTCDPYTEKSATLEFVFEKGKYQIEFGLIPQKAGIFNFNPYYDNVIPVGRENEVELTDSKCREIINYMRYHINEGNNNYPIREKHSDLSWARDDIQKHVVTNGSFSFIVK